MRQYVVLVLLTILAGSSSTAQTSIPERQREGKARAAAAQEYFEQLHAGPPGFQWRNVREAVRDLRRERRAQKRLESPLADIANGAWFEMGSTNQAGRVLCTTYDSATGRVWVASAGGLIWEGNLEGTSWKCLNDDRHLYYPRHIRYVKLSDGRERMIVAPANGTIWYRDDNGAWTHTLGLEHLRRYGYVTQVTSCYRNGQLRVYAMVSESSSSGDNYVTAFYESVDSASSFQRIHRQRTKGSKSLWSDGNNRVFILDADTIFSVTEDSRLEKLVTRSAPWSGTDVLLAAGGEREYYVLSGSEPSTLWTYDSNLGWKQLMEFQYAPFDVNSLHVVRSNPEVILVGGMELHRSVDRGRSFTTVNSYTDYHNIGRESKLHADIPAIESHYLKGGREFLLICTDGGLYVSHDYGRTVRNISLQGLNTSQYYSVFTSRDNVNVIYAGSQDQGFQRSRRDEGGPRKFEQTISGDYAHIVSTDKGHTLWTVYPRYSEEYPGFIMYIPNAEDDWRPLFKDFEHRNQLWLPPLAAHPTDPNRVYLAGGTRDPEMRGAYIYEYRVEDNTIRMDSLPFDFSLGQSSNTICALAIAPSQPSIMYAVTMNGRVWRSSGSRAIWQQRAGIGGANYSTGYAIEIDPRDANVLYIGGNGYHYTGMQRSTDGGASFTPMNGLPPCFVYDLALVVDESKMYAATDVGAFMYDMTTGMWTDLTEFGGPDQDYISVDYIPALKTVRFGTYGRGIWDYREGVSDVAADSPQAITTLNVSSTLTPTGPHIVVELGQGAEGATARWYDLNGRLITTTTYTTNEPTFTITDIPDGFPTMVVITTSRGVGGTVVAK